MKLIYGRPDDLKSKGAETSLGCLSSAVSVLAEKVVPVGEMTRSHVDEMVETARAAYDAVKAAHNGQHSLVDDAAKLLADMEALGGHINL